MHSDFVALGFSSREHMIGMMLLVTLLPMWLLGCFFVTQRHTLTMARLLNEQLAVAVMALPKRPILLGAVAGMFYALAFNVPAAQVDELLRGNRPVIAIFFGQLLVWIGVGSLFFVRFHVINLFYRLGNEIEISIFEQSRLEPFARVGMLDVAIVVGAMAVATVQSIDAHFRLENYLTALMVAIPGGAILLVRPMWTLHKRLVQRKKQLLDEIRLRIEAASEQGSDVEITSMELLLKRRDRVKSLHTWPLDVGIWSRLLFYVLIPPIAWSGSALVEVAIDGILGI